MDRKLNLSRLARDRGVNLRGVAVMALLSLGTGAIGATVALFAWLGVLPSAHVLPAMVLMACAASLLSSDLWQTDQELQDRRLGLSFRGEHRAVCAKAYDDLWIDEVDA